MGFRADSNITQKRIPAGFYPGRMLLCGLILLLSVTTCMAKESKEWWTNSNYDICALRQDTTPHYKLQMTPNISPAQPPRHITKWVINNIYFDLGKSNIRPDAAAELDKLAVLLKQHPATRIEISGYTDSRASSQHNINLSQRRAEAAKHYLVDKGISADRLSVKWYGKTHLANQCANGVNCTGADHQLNRRVEFKVLNN